MVSWNLFKNTKLPGCLRGVTRWGTLCCVAVFALALLPGCPPMVECTTNEECDDGDFCNGAEVCTDNSCVDGTAPCEADLCNEDTDTCAECNDNGDCDDGTFCNGAETCANGACVDGASPCAAGEICNEAADRCDECDSNDDCDDGAFCNGAETCNTDTGTCAAGANPCTDTQVCDENANTCVTPCGDDGDCDDGFFCNGAETCDTATGLCLPGSNPCTDDGVFCNGTESCSEATDSCVSSGDPCAGTANPVCDEDTNTCMMGTACDVDADCIDALFCNGTETCNMTTGFCQAGTSPCDPDNETCNEALDLCIENEGQTINFTLGVDNLLGTGDADNFQAPLEFNPPTGTTLPTFGNADSANGGDGTDRLSAFFNFTAMTGISATLTAIEQLTITDIGSAVTTLNGTNWTGVTSVTSSSSTNNNALVITNLPAIANIGLTSTNSGFNVGFQTAATSGTTDSLTVTLNNAGNMTNNGTLTITSGTTNGVETVNINATGSNVLNQFTQGTGNTMTTVNIAGSGSLMINMALDNSVTTINAADNTGGVNVGAGNGIVTATGGSGNDTFVFGANYANTDTINGGLGTNTLSITTAVSAPTTNQTNVSNIQALTISDAHTQATVASRFGTISTINLPMGSNAGSFTVASGTTVNLGAMGANNDSAGALTITVSGAAGNDTINMNVNDLDSTGAVTFNGVEIVNLASNVDLDGSAADGGVNNFGAAFTLPDVSGSTLTITGTEDVMFSAAVTARVINASTFTEKLLMSLNTAGNTTTSTVATGGCNITGGSNDDILVGSTSGDTITSGEGNNQVQPGRGIDSVSFGNGRNILDLEDLATAQMLAANRVTVSGFNADGTTFNANSGTIDAIRFAAVSSQGNLSDGASAAEFQSITTPTNVTVSAGVGIVELAFEFSSGADLGAGGTNELNGTTLLSACGALSGTTACTFTTNMNDDDIIIIAYQTSGGTTSAYIYHGNGAGGNTALVAAEISLVAIISGNVTVGGFDVSQFIN